MDIHQELQFGSEINEAEGSDHIENPSGFREQLTDFRNGTNDGEDKNFVPGDIVWVMRMTNKWWPGIICEPSSKGPKKVIDKENFLVKLFSVSFSVWATKSRIKEFTCCFDEMLKQNDSRSFIAAVQIAVNEISSHVKKELTCSCFQKPCPPKVLELKAFALSRFQPDKFLSFIKDLAIDGGSGTSRIQKTVTQDCVSKFYRSLGHQQLQVHQLSPNRNSTRKRSRNEAESNKNLKKKLGEKCVYGSNAGDIAKIMNSSSEPKEGLDSNGNSISFVQLLKDVEANRMNFASSSRPFETDDINFSSQSTSNPIPISNSNFENGPLPHDLVVFIKQKLEMMNSRMEKEGHTLSPEIRGKLEKEIRGFTEKYSSMLGSPDLNGTLTESNPHSNSNHQQPLPPDLVVFMKEKLDMMKTKIEKEGNTLSPEMRGKLENEIRGFEVKYSSIFGSSSS